MVSLAVVWWIWKAKPTELSEEWTFDMLCRRSTRIAARTATTRARIIWLSEKVKKSARIDKKRWLEEQVKEAEKAARTGNMADMNRCRRAFKPYKPMPLPTLKTENGLEIDSEEKKAYMWGEHYARLLHGLCVRERPPNEGVDADPTWNVEGHQVRGPGCKFIYRSKIPFPCPFRVEKLVLFF